MNSNYLYEDGTPVRIGKELSRGGEGRVCDIEGSADCVAKLFFHPIPEREAKLTAMIANPPGPLDDRSGWFIAWPRQLVYEWKGTARQCVGYTMNKLTGFEPLQNYLNPMNRFSSWGRVKWNLQIQMGLRLAELVHRIHEHGYVIGDINESNLMIRLVNNQFVIGMVDTDSFQVPNGNTVYRCIVGKPEYSAPELYQQDLTKVTRTPEHDRFALGVLIFQLLAEGSHPFRAASNGNQKTPTPEELIQRRDWPYSRSSSHKPPQRGVPLDVLPRNVEGLIRACFGTGLNNPKARPTAADWVNALEAALQPDNLKTCGCNDDHVYRSDLSDCPWCQRENGQNTGGKTDLKRAGKWTAPPRTNPPFPTKPKSKRSISSLPTSAPPTNTLAVLTCLSLILLFVAMVGLSQKYKEQSQKAIGSEIASVTHSQSSSPTPEPHRVSQEVAELPPSAEAPPTPNPFPVPGPLPVPGPDPSPSPGPAPAPKPLPPPTVTLLNHDGNAPVPLGKELRFKVKAGEVEYRQNANQWQIAQDETVRILVAEKRSLILEFRRHSPQLLPAEILRREWDLLPPNQPPSIQFVAADPVSPTANDPFTVRVALADADGDQVVAQYRMNSNSNWVSAESAEIELTVNSPGNSQLEFRAIDSRDAFSETIHPLIIVKPQNLAPTIAFKGALPYRHPTGTDLQIPVVASDPENDELKYEIQVNQGTWEPVEFPIQFRSARTGRKSLAVRAVDSHGNASEPIYHLLKVYWKVEVTGVRGRFVPPRNPAPSLRPDPYRAWQEQNYRDQRQGTARSRRLQNEYDSLRRGSTHW